MTIRLAVGLPIPQHRILQASQQVRHFSPKPSPTPNPPPSASLPPKVPKHSLVQRYTPALALISQRTGVPLPSLALSFLVLHEVTAILPVVGFYYLFASFGVGAGMVAWIAEIGNAEDGTKEAPPSGWKNWVKEWYDEGVAKVDKVGKMYGILGYEKQEQHDIRSGEDVVETRMIESEGAKAAEKVADAVAAYVLVKALLPVRIGLSIAVAPGFARYTLVPLQRLFRRG